MEECLIHSITSSAWTSSEAGTMRLSDFAIFRIDDELELACLHDRQIGGFRALEPSPRLNSDLPVDIDRVDPIAQQATVCCIFGKLVHRWHSMPSR